jgi:hypothetical protein
MQRRTVLAGAAAGVGLGTVGAYAGGLFDDPPFTLSVYNAKGDETDVTCDLPDGFLDDHPVLADLVAAAGDNPVSEPETAKITQDQAASILSDLSARCDTTGGLYAIRGEWYFISIQGDPHSHDDERDGHEH